MGLELARHRLQNFRAGIGQKLHLLPQAPPDDRVIAVEAER